jgi:hypothetical protein
MKIFSAELDDQNPYSAWTKRFIAYNFSGIGMRALLIFCAIAILANFGLQLLLTGIDGSTCAWTAILVCYFASEKYRQSALDEAQEESSALGRYASGERTLNSCS